MLCPHVCFAAYFTEASPLSELSAALLRYDSRSFAVLGECKRVVVHDGACMLLKNESGMKGSISCCVIAGTLWRGNKIEY